MSSSADLLTQAAQQQVSHRSQQLANSAQSSLRENIELLPDLLNAVKIVPKSRALIELNQLQSQRGRMSLQSKSRRTGDGERANSEDPESNHSENSSYFHELQLSALRGMRLNESQFQTRASRMLKEFQQWTGIDAQDSASPGRGPDANDAAALYKNGDAKFMSGESTLNRGIRNFKERPLNYANSFKEMKLQLPQFKRAGARGGPAGEKSNETIGPSTGTAGGGTTETAKSVYSMQTVPISHIQVQPFAERARLGDLIVEKTLKSSQKYEALQQAKIENKDRITIKSVKHSSSIPRISEYGSGANAANTSAERSVEKQSSGGGAANTNNFTEIPARQIQIGGSNTITRKIPTSLSRQRHLGSNSSLPQTTLQDTHQRVRNARFAANPQMRRYGNGRNNSNKQQRLLQHMAAQHDKQKLIPTSQFDTSPTASQYDHTRRSVYVRSHNADHIALLSSASASNHQQRGSGDDHHYGKPDSPMEDKVLLNTGEIWSILHHDTGSQGDELNTAGKVEMQSYLQDKLPILQDIDYGRMMRLETDVKTKRLDSGLVPSSEDQSDLKQSAMDKRRFTQPGIDGMGTEAHYLREQQDLYNNGAANPSAYINVQMLAKKAKNHMQVAKQQHKKQKRGNYLTNDGARHHHGGSNHSAYTISSNQPMNSYDQRFKQIRQKALAEHKETLQKVETQKKITQQVTIDYLQQLQAARRNDKISAQQLGRDGLAPRYSTTSGEPLEKRSQSNIAVANGRATLPKIETTTYKHADEQPPQQSSVLHKIGYNGPLDQNVRKPTNQVAASGTNSNLVGREFQVENVGEGEPIHQRSTSSLVRNDLSQQFESMKSTHRRNHAVSVDRSLGRVSETLTDNPSGGFHVAYEASPIQPRIVFKGEQSLKESKVSSFEPIEKPAILTASNNTKSQKRKLNQVYFSKVNLVTGGADDKQQSTASLEQQQALNSESTQLLKLGKLQNMTKSELQLSNLQQAMTGQQVTKNDLLRAQNLKFRASLSSQFGNSKQSNGNGNQQQFVQQKKTKMIQLLDKNNFVINGGAGREASPSGDPNGSKAIVYDEQQPSGQNHRNMKVQLMTESRLTMLTKGASDNKHLNGVVDLIQPDASKNSNHNQQQFKTQEKMAKVIKSQKEHARAIRTKKLTPAETGTAEKSLESCDSPKEIYSRTTVLVQKTATEDPAQMLRKQINEMMPAQKTSLTTGPTNSILSGSKLINHSQLSQNSVSVTRLRKSKDFQTDLLQMYQKMKQEDSETRQVQAPKIKMPIVSTLADENQSARKSDNESDSNLKFSNRSLSNKPASKKKRNYTQQLSLISRTRRQQQTTNNTNQVVLKPLGVTSIVSRERTSNRSIENPSGSIAEQNTSNGVVSVDDFLKKKTWQERKSKHQRVPSIPVLGSEQAEGPNLQSLPDLRRLSDNQISMSSNFLPNQLASKQDASIIQKYGLRMRSLNQLSVTDQISENEDGLDESPNMSPEHIVPLKAKISKQESPSRFPSRPSQIIQTRNQIENILAAGKTADNFNLVPPSDKQVKQNKREVSSLVTPAEHSTFEDELKIGHVPKIVPTYIQVKLTPADLHEVTLRTPKKDLNKVDEVQTEIKQVEQPQMPSQQVKTKQPLQTYISTKNHGNNSHPGQAYGVPGSHASGSQISKSNQLGGSASQASGVRNRNNLSSQRKTELNADMKALL